MKERRFIEYKCNYCGNLFKNNKKITYDHFCERKRAYCSKECSKEYCREISRKTLSITNRKYASKRMQIRNPSFIKENLEKIRKTKLKNGTLNTPPKIQGGNGRETPLPVIMLNEILKWELCFIQKTGVKEYYPTHYKLEIANPEKKVCIEIDGQSCYSRKDLMLKKQEYLEGIGWKVFRFKNKEVLKNPTACAEEILRYVNNL